MRVLLANTRQKVRSALRLLLAQKPEFQVVGEAADATGVLLAVERKQPDLLLLDWGLPGLPSDYLLRLLRRERPSLKIIALSSRPEVQQLALAAGADSFINKNEPPERALAALQTV
ncbi:MAG TPA: response regulator transcription factor [Anaerolineae bacterium]|nr:response regulator transcription factor [Anaerolineae bacterium]HIP71822.1 response regulator transcription factor [Anaerolineae bacterium]